MRSVADQLRSEDQQKLLRLTASERVELAFRLGDDDLETFRAAHGLTREEALARLRRQRQIGRRPCSFLE